MLEDNIKRQIELKLEKHLRSFQKIPLNQLFTRLLSLSGSKSLLKSITYNGFRATKSVKLVKNNSIGSQTLQYLVKYH